MLIGGLSIAAAASPSVRVALQHVLPFPLPGNAGAASNAQGEPIAIYPKPPFTIFYPRPVPTGMLIHVIIHFKNGTPVAGPTGGANCGLDPHPGVCAQRIANLSVLLGIFPGMKDSPYSSTLAQPIWKRNVDVVWFGMRTFPPRGGYIELAEWRNRALPLVLHRNAQINGHYAMVRKHGLFTMVSVVRDGTAVVLRSNMGREFTLRAAASLQKIAIAGRSG
jgi:hypothetical protein